MSLFLKNVGQRFGDKQALTGITATLEANGVIGLIGPNGAGKSTLLKLLATLAKPSSGTILLDDVDIVRQPQKMRQVLGLRALLLARRTDKLSNRYDCCI